VRWHSRQHRSPGTTHTRGCCSCSSKNSSSVIEQIRSCNRSLALIELGKGHLAVRINALTFRPTSIDTYKAFTGAVARDRFLVFLPASVGKLAGSTGTGGFVLDRDHLISESFNFANPPKNIAKNENSKSINIIKPNKNRATTNIKNFASKLL
jgi:hypothetical protein